MLLMVGLMLLDLTAVLLEDRQTPLVSMVNISVVTLAFPSTTQVTNSTILYSEKEFLYNQARTTIKEYKRS